MRNEINELLTSYQWLLDAVQAATGILPTIAYEEDRKTVRITFAEGVPTYRPEWESYNADGSLAVKFSLNAEPQEFKDNLLAGIVSKLQQV